MGAQKGSRGLSRASRTPGDGLEKDRESREAAAPAVDPDRTRGGPSGAAKEPYMDTYVRPHFPPLSSEKPPAPFLEVLKERRIINDKDLSKHLASVR